MSAEGSSDKEQFGLTGTPLPQVTGCRLAETILCSKQLASFAGTGQPIPDPARCRKHVQNSVQGRAGCFRHGDQQSLDRFLKRVFAIHGSENGISSSFLSRLRLTVPSSKRLVCDAKC